MMKIFDYLRARFTELTSLAATIGLPAIWLGYWAGSVTLDQAKYASAAAVVAYLFPEKKVVAAVATTKPPPAPALAIAAIMLGLAGCTDVPATVAALAKDPAAFCLKAVSMGGTLTVGRNGGAGSVTCE